MIARYGGDEFILLLPETDLEQVALLTEKCRNKILEKSIDFQTSNIINIVSISLGECTTIPTNDAAPSALLKATDKALYRAKESGRNRVETCRLYPLLVNIDHIFSLITRALHSSLRRFSPSGKKAAYCTNFSYN